MADQDRRSHPVDKFIHALYGETQERFSGYGNYPDNKPGFADVCDYVDEHPFEDDGFLIQMNNLRSEYVKRSVPPTFGLDPHLFRGHVILESGAMVACDSVEGVIDPRCNCGHTRSEHYDDHGGRLHEG